MLAQQFNALLLANGDQFDWVANEAAYPYLGATGAYANTTYFNADAGVRDASDQRRAGGHCGGDAGGVRGRVWQPDDLGVGGVYAGELGSADRGELDGGELCDHAGGRECDQLQRAGQAVREEHRHQYRDADADQ